MNTKLLSYLSEHRMIDLAIEVSVSQQRCNLYNRNNDLLACYPVSTAENGVNAQEGSFGTPPGLHKISECIGAGEALGMSFVGRQATGCVATIEPKAPACRTNGDFILSRILWLEGLEPGLNAGAGVDSKQRYIYFHGTNEEYLLGQEASHGCIRMKNDDVIDLFDRVSTGTPVYIGD